MGLSSIGYVVLFNKKMYLSHLDLVLGQSCFD